MLFEKLFKDNKINDNILDKIKKEIEKSQKTEEEIILKNNILSEKELFELKSKIFEIELFNVNDFMSEALQFIPINIAKDHKIIPVKKKDNCLYIGMIYPESQNAHEFINLILKKNKLISKIYLLSFSLFEQLLKEYKDTEEVEKELYKIKEEEPTKSDTEEQFNILETAPIIKIVNVILEQAIDGNASDIHIEPILNKTRVRFRVIGKLYNSMSLPAHLIEPIVGRIKILSRLKTDENRRPQDGRFSIVKDKRKIDFRVSIFPIQNKEKAVLRVLDSAKSKIPQIEDIGFLKKETDQIKREIRKPYGLVLVSGPTGSGKTTTLLALLNNINQEDINIITIEEPIEYTIDGINQSQIRPDIGYTFANGLRSILRQDPDVIMVGEIRDKETAGLVVNAALTGHLVLSTLHTNNVLGVILRLVDMGVDPFLIAPIFNLAVSQRLVRTLCSTCKEKKILKNEEKKIIKNLISSFFDDNLKDKYLHLLNKTSYLYMSVGCLRCNKIGYSGRIAVTEILYINYELTGLIAKGPTEDEIITQIRKQKMITMQQNGIIKVLEGITTIEEVLRQTKKE